MSTMATESRKPPHATSAANRPVGTAIALWGIVQVVAVLLMPIRKLAPIALQPIVKKSFTHTQAFLCVLWCIMGTYMIGYRGIRQKFSPLVIQRAFGLQKNKRLVNWVLAGPYCMGLFGATSKRMIKSWSMAVTMTFLSKLVKQLPSSWAAVVDAGVVAGLTLGTTSICEQTVRALCGTLPGVDECLRSA